MNARFSISCIIPAYNEGPRIGAVLDVALATPGIDDVIVVDDGSKDDTVAVAKARANGQPRLRVVVQPQNGGKTRAVARGVTEARGTHLLLLDSDLIGLTPNALGALIGPVANRRADVSLSLRRNAPAPWRWIGLDYISGERVIPRRILADHLTNLDALPRFGLEVFMNRLWIGEGLRIAVVPWRGVTSPLKSVKQGFWRGLIADMRMIGDILRTIGLAQVLRQIRAMRALRV